jgi:DNA-binding transcriptional LysR family regulator
VRTVSSSAPASTPGIDPSSDAASQLLSRRALPPFETLRAFDAIARLGGVRKAAQYLCRDHAVVSRHLRAIEDWTGTQLIRRTPAGSVLTEEGLRYHRDIASALDLIARATVDLIKRGSQSQSSASSDQGAGFTS